MLGNFQPNNWKTRTHKQSTIQGKTLNFLTQELSSFKYKMTKNQKNL